VSLRRLRRAQLLHSWLSRDSIPHGLVGGVNDEFVTVHDWLSHVGVGLSRMRHERNCSHTGVQRESQPLHGAMWQRRVIPRATQSGGRRGLRHALHAIIFLRAKLQQLLSPTVIVLAMRRPPHDRSDFLHIQVLNFQLAWAKSDSC